MRREPRIISFVGPDGCGKSTLARIAAEELRKQGLCAQVVWSRFNNFLSKPLLALARCTGHNRREVHDGRVYGYHDFRSATLLRYPFILLQVIDVNLAFFAKARRIGRGTDVVVFERSPWDTLADVILDTGCQPLVTNAWGRMITAQIRGRGPVFWVKRPRELVLSTRPELGFDHSLDAKTAIYAQLAPACGWEPFDNDRPLEEVTRKLSARLMQHEGALHG